MTRIALMFHDVYHETPLESGFSGTGPDLYKIKENSFECIIRHLYEKDKVKTYILTFDDGGVSFYTIIAPILEKYNLKGIFFIATESIGKDGFLSKEQIAELDKRGHIIGSHSHTHKRLTTLTKNEVENEWKQSKTILESIVKHPVTLASVPNGYQSNVVISEAQKCGYTDIYTSEPTCRIKLVENIKLHGRFVLMKDVSVSEVDRLSMGVIRMFLLIRARALMSLQKIMGPYYKKIRNFIFK